MDNTDKSLNSVYYSRKLISISQAASILDVSFDTLRRWEKKGIIKSVRIFGKTRYFFADQIHKIKNTKLYTISKAAQVLRISITTLRRIEKRGLFTTNRNSQGYRLYSKQDLSRLRHSQYFSRRKVALDCKINNSLG